jgi:hypothetical protein
VTVVAGCAAAKQTSTAHKARSDLVGMTRSEIEDCAGEPLRVEYAGNYKYLIYHSSMEEPPGSRNTCVATFLVRNDYVESLDYETPAGRLIGDHARECFPIVERCMPDLNE